MGFRKELWTHSKLSQDVGSGANSQSNHAAQPAEHTVGRSKLEGRVSELWWKGTWNQAFLTQSVWGQRAAPLTAGPWRGRCTWGVNTTSAPHLNNGLAACSTTFQWGETDCRKRDINSGYWRGRQSLGSLVLSRCLNVTNGQMSDDFIHVLMVEQRLEAGLVCKKKRKIILIDA